jgi:hypothetical protein
MRSSSVRLTLLAAAAIAVVVLFVAGDFVSPRPVLASHTGGADNFLIDMNATGNTATSITSIELCARINENNVQDADEDGIDTVSIDVVTGPAGVPASNRMSAYAFVRPIRPDPPDRTKTGQLLASARRSLLTRVIPGPTRMDFTVARRWTGVVRHDSGNPVWCSEPAIN